MQAVTLEAMPIALLLDGQKNPPSFKTDQTSEFIGYPRGGTVRNFRLMRKLSDEMVLIYRGSNCQLSDEEFESLAHRELIHTAGLTRIATSTAKRCTSKNIMSDSEKSFPPELADALADQITVPRILVTVGGGLLPAAWLSQALIWTNESDDSEGWFEASSPDWERDAGFKQGRIAIGPKQAFASKTDWRHHL